MHLALPKIISAVLTFLVVVGLLLWLMLRTIKNAEDPAKMTFKWVITWPVIILAFAAIPMLSFFGPFVIVFCAVILSALWTPHIGAGFAKPLTSLFDGGDLPPEDRPAYSVAWARQKRGDYLQAVAETRKQLERFPADFEGHMLLAQIQAENLKDLPGAELTIQRFCDQPHHAPKNITFALFSMADWYLRFSQDREAARRCLQKIIDVLPDTEFALTAAQRIAHLGTAEMLLSPHDRKKYTVPEALPNLGLVQPRDDIKPVEMDPGEQAGEYVRHLKFHPLDTEVRENLAILYTDHYHRLDLAADQLEQMIAEPHQPARLIVHWLNLMADLQIRSGADFDTVKETLQRIIDTYPKLAAAEIARKRLDLLKLELKGKEKSLAAIKLGTYEQKIGLKPRRARGE
ncbi:MAG TPA: tetratricopeptide repeat protein [Candidatus Binatia bacterium]|jgi:tetratricopeptide (TPR) repeat protein|nr:tetratricopeptide repeat protein [Candidatus Binatia bacterium]